MNIRDYYAGMSKLYLHQSILCVFVFIVIILPALQIISFLPTDTASVFLIMLLVYYILRHLYFAYKSHTLPNPTFNLDQGEVLLMLEPSPVTAYQGKLFSGSGICAISIKKGRKRAKENYFSITDHRKNIYWNARFAALNIQLLKGGKETSFTVLKSNKREYRTPDGERYRIVKSPYSYFVKKNGVIIMTVSKGLMPISLQRIFSASTPIIKFGRQINEEERIFCLLLYFIS